MALFLPIFTYLSAELVGGALMQRAAASPILIGAKGNEFDLTMSSLYFRGQVADPIPMAERSRAQDYGLAIPLYVMHSAGGSPIVGTSLEYLEARRLRLASGRTPAVLGEVVAGAAVARHFDLEPGDTVRSDLTNLYNIAGAYPTILEVVGILSPSGSADDSAYFADVRTTWLLDGRLHGHTEVSREQSLNPEAEEGDNLEATAAIFLFAEVTQRNLANYHGHGSEADAPLTSVLLYPDSQRAHDQVLADFALVKNLQAVRPTEVMRTVLGIVVRVEEGLSVYFATVAFSTLAFFILVIALSLRLRRREMALMKRIGCSRPAVFVVVATEIFLVVAAALVLTTAMTWGGVSLIQNRLGL